MKKPFLFFIAIAISQYALPQTVPYPTTKKESVTDDYLNQYKVTDDYRWMENLNSPDLKKWIDRENDITHKYLAHASLSNSTKTMVNTYQSGLFNTLYKRGKYYFYYGFYEANSAPALYIQLREHDDEPHIVVNPNFISHKDKIALRDFAVSADSKYLAFEYTRNGSEKGEIGIAEVESGAILKDNLTNIKLTNIYWQGNGFYYSTTPAEGQAIYFHRMGTAQSQDELVFKRANNPDAEFSFLVTKDHQYFILQEQNKTTDIFNYFYVNFNEPEPRLRPMITNSKFNVEFVGSHDGKLIAKDYYDAPNGNIVEIDPLQPANYKVITPAQGETVLKSVLTLKGKMVALYQSNFRPMTLLMDYNGKIFDSYTFSLGSSVSDMEAELDDDQVIYRYDAYTLPPVTYHYNISDYKRLALTKTTITYDYLSYNYQVIKYPTADSTKVPMLLIYKKDIKLDGKNPALLETNGSFKNINSPTFNPGLVYFLERGGVYAFAFVRGQGDRGTDWADAGRGANKQTSFNDFISAAEYLVANGYTNSSKLAITGFSNGGLVAAVAAIQRPELFKAVVTVVSPFDMLRYENFTKGAAQEAEYGSVKNKDDFMRLWNYSPYANIKPNVNYPSMLIITGDHDDYIPPFHSYKFAAALQNRPAQTNPVYLLVNKQAGHEGIANDSVYGMLNDRIYPFAFIADMLK